MFDGIARRVSLCDGVAQLDVEVNSQTLMMSESKELNKPQTSAVNMLLKLPFQGRTLSCAIARELKMMKIGHRVLITVTEYVGGRKFYDIFNKTAYSCL